MTSNPATSNPGADSAVTDSAMTGAGAISPRTAQLLTAAGLDPAQAFRPYGFSYHFGFRCHPKLFVVWTIPSQCNCGRCCPSSLYTFPMGLARDCQLKGFPEF